MLFLKKILSLKFLRQIKSIILNIPRHPIQNKQPPTSKDHKVVFLGSKYGGKYVLDEKLLENCIMISAGLGCDASFDIEFINKYNAKVIVIDPTPKAILHYKKIIKNLGFKQKEKYNESGA